MTPYYFYRDTVHLASFKRWDIPYNLWFPAIRWAVCKYQNRYWCYQADPFDIIFVRELPEQLQEMLSGSVDDYNLAREFLQGMPYYTAKKTFYKKDKWVYAVPVPDCLTSSIDTQLKTTT